MLPLQSPNIKWTKSVEHPLLYLFNFCSTVFVPLFLFHSFCSTIFVLQFFIPLFLFCWPFCTCTWGLRHPMVESPHQFLFHNFCSADLFALVLTNFCSIIFVPQFLFHWPFCTCTWGLCHPMADSAHQFLFHWPFCTCTVPTNFCLGDSE